MFRSMLITVLGLDWQMKKWLKREFKDLVFGYCMYELWGGNPTMAPVPAYKASWSSLSSLPRWRARIRHSAAPVSFPVPCFHSDCGKQALLFSLAECLSHTVPLLARDFKGYPRRHTNCHLHICLKYETRQSVFFPSLPLEHMTALVLEEMLGQMAS